MDLPVLSCVIIGTMAEWGGGFKSGWWSPRQLYIPVQTVVIFYFPGIDTRYKGPTAFSVSSERHWQNGANGIANVPKRSFCSGIRTRPGTVRSPVQANALTHSATALWS